MEINNQIVARMRELALYQRAGLISSYQSFLDGKIEELSVNRDVQTLTAFIDATGSSELPDDICPECLCHIYSMNGEPPYTGGHGWHCSKDPSVKQQRTELDILIATKDQTGVDQKEPRVIYWLRAGVAGFLLDHSEADLRAQWATLREKILAEHGYAE